MLQITLNPRPRMVEVRSLFLSDVHLGSSKSQASECIEMLRNYKFQTLYIVGDFIDIWSLKRKRFWPQVHTNLIRKILKRSKDSKIVYVLGNHDEFLGNFLFDMIGDWGNITICEKYTHISATNKRYLVMHGHQFDYLSKHAKWVERFGDIGYEALLMFNRWFNFFRKTLGFSYWSLSAYVKNKVKSAINFVSNFESSVAHFAENEKVDGIIAGHLHSPNIRNINGVMYYNTGDWVEHRSILIEDFDGNFSLARF